MQTNWDIPLGVRGVSRVRRVPDSRKNSMANTKRHFHYLAFGQRICSTISLPGFASSDFSNGYNVAVRLMDYTDGKIDSDYGLPVNRLSTNLDLDLIVYEHSRGYLLRFEGACDFVVSDEGSTIEVNPYRGVTAGWLQNMIYGMLMAFSLHLRGTGNLHASSVEIPGGAVAFLGEPGAGKSTMAAAFAERGHSVISDDVLVIESESGKYLAQPGVSHLTLSKVSMNTVGRGNMETESLISVGEKLRLPVDGSWASFAKSPVALKGMFLLSRGAEGTEITVERMSVIEATREAVTNTLCLPILPKNAVKRFLAFSANLAMSIPVWKLRYAEGRASLGQIHRTVLETVNGQ